MSLQALNEETRPRSLRRKSCYFGRINVSSCTVNSQFKKDLKLQIHLHEAFFSDDRFLDSLHKSFLNQTTLDLRKEKWTFLNREFTV